MSVTELPQAGTPERVETLLRVAADLSERSPKARRRWRWLAALWVALLVPLVIGVEHVSSRMTAGSRKTNRSIPTTSVTVDERGSSPESALTTAVAGAATSTATRAPSAPAPTATTAPAITIAAAASLDALPPASDASATTAPVDTTPTTIDATPSATDAPADDTAPPPTSAPRRTPRTTAPAATIPPPATTIAPPPATTPAPTTPPATSPPATDPPPTNPPPPPPAFAVRPDAFSVPGSGATVHPLANDSGVQASSLTLTGVPFDVRASTDGSGGVVVSASLGGGTQRSIYYSVCDPGGSHCATARISVTFT